MKVRKEDACTATCIVAAARGQVGAKYRHQGRIARSKDCQGWLDCLGLLMVVAQECRLVGYGSQQTRIPLTTLDRVDYGHYPDGQVLARQLAACMPRVETGRLTAGDVLLLEVDGVARHLAIVTPYAEQHVGMVHAYAPLRRVVEHRLDKDWYSAIRGVFRPSAVEKS